MAITLDQWIAELGEDIDELPKKLRDVVEQSAKDVRDEWQRRWRGLGPHVPYLWASIDYDIDQEGMHAEIGADKSKPQGPLANLLEFGSIHNAPQPGGAPALDMVEPKFAKRAEDALVELLEKER